MEHHIAQSSPISPRQKGMEGSRQALLYGVYDAFAGARTLISKRLCALITAIGIAVLTISSSAWATHPALNTESAPFDDIDGVQLQPNSVHTDDLEPDAVTSDKIGAGEVCGSEAGTSAACAGTTPADSDIGAGSIGTADLAEVDTAGPEEGQNGAVGTTNINDGAVTSDKLKSFDSTGTTEAEREGAVTTDKINPEAVTTDKLKKVIPTTAQNLPNEGTEGAVNEDNINNEAVTSRTLKKVNVADADPATVDGEDGAVNEDNINNDAVTTRTILDGAVTTDKLAPNAVQGGNIGANQVCGSATTTDCQVPADGHISEGSIGTDDLATVNPPGNPDAGQGGAVSNNNINDNAVDARTIGTGAVTENKLGSGAVTENKLGRFAVTTDKIENGAVDATKLKTVVGNTGMDGAVNEDNINNNAISSRTIQDGAVGGRELEAAQICGSADDANCDGAGNRRTHIRTRSIGTTDLAEVNDPDGTTDPGLGGAVNTNNINNGAIDSRTIRDLGVETVDLADNAVETDKILDQAVTTNKLKQVDTEGPQEGLNGAVNTNNINNNAVTNEKIFRSAVTEDKIRIGAVRERHIANRQVIGRHIDDGAISRRHLGPDIENIFRRIEGDIDRLDEGIAMSHAISMIKVPEGKEFGISFAGGFYQDKQAAAIGVGFRPTDGLLLSAGASYGFDSEEIGGAVSINFGF